MADDQNCEHCGGWWEDHGYEHLARYCYPLQVEKLEGRVEKLRAALDEALSLVDSAPGCGGCDDRLCAACVSKRLYTVLRESESMQAKGLADE